MQGKKFAREVAEFGEHVWYYKPGITGRDKLDVRWESGRRLGIRDESGQVIIGTRKGILKAGSVRRKPARETWNSDELTEMKGLPWDPTPGLGERETKSSVYEAGSIASRNDTRMSRMQEHPPRRGEA